MRAKKTTELKFRNANDAIKEFYFYLGLLSTKFSILEYNTLLLLGRLITDDLFLTNTLLERNTLSQNIQMLKKINKFRRFEEKKMSILISKISEVRSIRNLFIHGVWGSPTSRENDTVITCSNPKIVYEESNGGQTWTSARNHSFRLSYIVRLIEQVDVILLEQEYMFNKLDEEEEQF